MDRRLRRRCIVTRPERLESRVALSADSSFASQWNLENLGQTGGRLDADIDAPEAWQFTTGSRSVVVAVIDSGIDFTHPDLAANIWRNPREIASNGVDDDKNGYVDDVHGWDFVDGDNTPQDGFGHGTHVAGIIGAVGNNGIGIAGVAWQVSILPVRFQNNSGVGYTGAAISALRYVNGLARAGVPIVAVNLSFGGGTSFSQTFQDAITTAGSLGITCVVASGNNGADTDIVPRYPGSYAGANVITVAAADASDLLWSGSNFGRTSVDVAAPGIGILSTLPGGRYGTMSGTSMAAPHVTGTVALLAARKPGITVGEVRSAILGGVDPLPSLVGKVASGGRLNAFAALGRVASVVPPPAPAPLPGPTPSPVPSQLFADSFSRPDASALSSPWRMLSGRLAISSGRVVSKASGASVAVVESISATDVTVRSSVSLGTASSVGLVARQTSSGMYFGSLTKTSTGVVARIWKLQGTTWTKLGSVKSPAQTGMLEFSAAGTRLAIALDGRQLLAVNDGSILGPGSAGYRMQGVGGTADEFSVTRV